ncbi:NAD-glutamate dehydrogenase [Mycolicibacterium fallax]|uniref:NAD-glutamate dehydrogenase n=1 Tax=Mycolicibacterium fallax TaxID=1793 RepID=UPI000A15C732|nr:NAD-glutamate dehydrogenase [Mycolicibacterium fallax]BBY98053.1 NAD-specific glutamate dehydrogenase [Mycolicibacterium fallax]
MTENPQTHVVEDWSDLAPAAAAAVSAAYAATYRGPQGDAPQIDVEDAERPGAVTVPAALPAAQFDLGRRRGPGQTLIGSYPADQAGGFGPALQVVTDAGPMVMDSVRVLLHRLGVAYLATMNPVLRVRRNADGELLELGPVDGRHPGDEVWIHVQLSPTASRSALAAACAQLPGVLADAHQAGLDADAMRKTMLNLSGELAFDDGSRFPGPDRADVAALLRWLADGHFVLLGYQRCPVRDGRSTVDAGSRLGTMRLRTEVLPQLTANDELLVLAHATVPSYLRYGAQPYIVVIREHPDNHAVEHRFVGLFTVTAVNTDVLDLPLIATRVHDALALAQADPNNPGALLLDVLQTIPRPELFSLSGEQMYDMARTVIEMGSRRRTLLFARVDGLGHFVSCLVYLPRDRYTTAVRLQMQDILVREFGGTGIEYSARVSESPWAVVHFTVRLPGGVSPGDIDVSPENETRIQDLLTAAARTWGDRLLRAAVDGKIDQGSADYYADAFPEAYRQAVSPAQAIADIAIVEGLQDDSVKLVLSEPDSDEDGATLTWFLGGRSASLSDLLPMLQCMGVEVLDERPFAVTRPDGLAVRIYQFRIALPRDIAGAGEADMNARFADTVTAIWQGRVEADRFNELVLRAALTWQQVVVIRTYAKYLRQAGFPYSQSYIESVLTHHPDTVGALVALFEAIFDPTLADEERAARAQAAASAVATDIDALVSMDIDRVLRAFASLIQATLRTNYFVTRADSVRTRGVLAIKLNPTLIDELPLPRPKFEIFVYSPSVEGVHLRFGAVARGGLRWSDRREDFRTEVLGLVKAQAVKNAVIVPVGAKGGFVVKNPPAPTGDAAADRDAVRDEGVRCYRLFVAGLLELTDNVDRATGAVTPPPQVVRRDGDDAYLVVAADKGTATFSDIANGVAAEYGHWLGDAFASGGSVGYDHKEMGITAKGGWESVKRHFRELGQDTQREDFTVVGIGDMSGDVFGNGMLLSEHIRLVAAFNHLHIFLDPDPDPADSLDERQRMFALPRSSWDDYDRARISAGGGVYSRQQKAIPISPQVAARLGLDESVTELAPPALVRAILTAPVDLLWNGGIGTYIKAEAEADSDVGDRANDAVRINGNQVGARVIGEGGNLGVTPRGRIEANLCGTRINTDALDNSAGVDCSDHEVNIKILVDALVTQGKVDPAERSALLESMTDEVGELVLEDNRAQNDLMGTSRAGAVSLLNVHARQIEELETRRDLNRELEALPSNKVIARRIENGQGLTSPELATLMAHVKLALKDDVLATELPDQEVFTARLPEYFPARLRDRFAAEIRNHQLRREIVATQLVNDVIDTAGISYAYRVTEDTGVDAVDAVRAFAAADAIFGIGGTWRSIRAASLAHPIPVHTSDRMTLELRRLIDRAARWLVNHRPQPLAVGAEINRFAAKVAALRPRLPEWLRGLDADIVAKQTGELVADGVPADLAHNIATDLYQFSLLDVIDIADITDRDLVEVADTYFALLAHLDTDRLLTAVSELPRDDRWHALARLALRDDIYASIRALTFDVLSVGEPEETGEQKIAEWRQGNSARLARANRTLAEIAAAGEFDLATLSVAARQIRNMTISSGTGQ